MQLPTHKCSAYTLIGFAKKFQDFFHGEPQDVTFEYMSTDCEILSETVPNLAKIKEQVEASAGLSEEEINELLKNYYTKIECDSIRDAILANLNNYYTKTEVDNIIDKVYYDMGAIDYNTYFNLCRTRSMMFGGNGILRLGNVYRDNNRYDYDFMYNKDIFIPDKLYTPNMTNKIVIGGIDYKGCVPVKGFEGGHPIYNANGRILHIIGTYQNGEGALINLPEPPTLKGAIEGTTLTSNIEKYNFYILDLSGHEHLSNGDFTDNVDGWEVLYSDASDGSFSHNSDNQTLLMSSDSGPYNITTTFNIVPKLRYKLEYKIKINSGTCYIKACDNLTYDDNVFNNILLEGDVLTLEHEIIFDEPNGSITIDLPEGGDIELHYISLKAYADEYFYAYENLPANTSVFDFSFYYSIEFRDTISRQDMVILEVSDEKISDTGLVFPYGNKQYSLNTMQYDGFQLPKDIYTLMSSGANIYPGKDILSAHRNYTAMFPDDQYFINSLAYVWDELTNDEKRVLIEDPRNNIYIKDKEYYQTRYRYRVIKGHGNKWKSTGRFDPYLSSISYGNSDTLIYKSDEFVKGMYEDFHTNIEDYTDNYDDRSLTVINDEKDIYTTDFKITIPIALIQRRNDGIFDIFMNKTGTAIQTTGVLGYYDIFNSLGGMGKKKYYFDKYNIAAFKIDGYPTNALDSEAVYISGYYYPFFEHFTMSGALGFCNKIEMYDVEDLRFFAEYKNKKDMIDKIDELIVNDIIVGKEPMLGFKRLYSLKYKNNITYGYVHTLTKNKISKYRNINYRNTDNNTKYIPAEMVILNLRKNNDYFNSIWNAIYFKNIPYIENRKNINTYMDDPAYQFSLIHGYADFLPFKESPNTEYETYLNNIDLTDYTDILDIYTSYNIDDYTFNGVKKQIDIFIDISPIGDRIKYISKSGIDYSVLINKNTLVYVESTNKYYISKLNRDFININSDVEDFTNTDNWQYITNDHLAYGLQDKLKKYGVLGNINIIRDNDVYEHKLKTDSSYIQIPHTAYQNTNSSDINWSIDLELSHPVGLGNPYYLHPTINDVFIGYIYTNGQMTVSRVDSDFYSVSNNTININIPSTTLNIINRFFIITYKTKTRINNTFSSSDDLNIKSVDYYSKESDSIFIDNKLNFYIDYMVGINHASSNSKYTINQITASLLDVKPYVETMNEEIKHIFNFEYLDKNNRTYDGFIDTRGGKVEYDVSKIIERLKYVTKGVIGIGAIFTNTSTYYKFSSYNIYYNLYYNTDDIFSGINNEYRSDNRWEASDYIIYQDSNIIRSVDTGESINISYNYNLHSYAEADAIFKINGEMIGINLYLDVKNNDGEYERTDLGDISKFIVKEDKFRDVYYIRIPLFRHVYIGTSDDYRLVFENNSNIVLFVIGEYYVKPEFPKLFINDNIDSRLLVNSDKGILEIKRKAEMFVNYIGKPLLTASQSVMLPYFFKE